MLIAFAVPLTVKFSSQPEVKSAKQLGQSIRAAMNGGDFVKAKQGFDDWTIRVADQPDMAAELAADPGLRSWFATRRYQTWLMNDLSDEAHHGLRTYLERETDADALLAVMLFVATPESPLRWPLLVHEFERAHALARFAIDKALKQGDATRLDLREFSEWFEQLSVDGS